MTSTDLQPGGLAGARGTVRYRRWRPAGPPVALVLLLHGLGEHSGQYDPLGSTLAAAGVEVWAPDHAGHGHSDGERVLIRDIDDLVDDAETLLRAARAGRPRLPFVVVGHSLGATIATLLVGEVRATAAADPAEGAAGLVLAGSAVAVGTGVLTGLLNSGIDLMALRRDPGTLVRDPEQAQRVREDPLVWAGGLRPETLRALIAAGSRTQRLLSIGALDHLPVLLLHGERDDLAPVDSAVEVAEALPRGRIVVYPDDRHNILHELDRDAVHAELLRFVLAVTDGG